MLMDAAPGFGNAELDVATHDPDRNHFDNLVTIDTVVPGREWRDEWIGKHIARRRQSPWAGKIDAVKLKGGLTPGQ